MKRILLFLALIAGLAAPARAQKTYVGPIPSPYTLLSSDSIYAYRADPSSPNQFIAMGPFTMTQLSAIVGGGAGTVTQSGGAVGEVCYFSGTGVITGSAGLQYSAGTLSSPGLISNTLSVLNSAAINYPTLYGPVTYVAGAVGFGTAPVFQPYNMPALAIDTTQSWNYVVLTDSDTGHPNEALTFTADPSAPVAQFSVLVKNTGSVLHTPTYRSSWSFNGGGLTTSVRIQPNSFVLLTWRYDATSTYYVAGDPRTISDLGATGGPLPTDVVGVEQSAAPGVLVRDTIPQVNVKSITFNFNGSGGVLTTGAKAGTFVKAPYGGTLIGWTATCYPSGSVTVDILRSSSGSGYAGLSSITGSGTKPNTSSSTEGSGTSFTSWGSTTITAGDMFEASLTADGVAQYATVDLYWE